MRGDLSLSASTALGFLLVLARVAGTFVFVPLPGGRNGSELAKVVLSATVAFSMFPQWPVVDASRVDLDVLLGWLLAEASFGITVGLAVGFVAEAFQMGAQVLSLQAGFSYASIVDPNTDAESGVMLLLAQLLSGLLFFALGLDRQVLTAFSRSLQVYPPGSFTITLPIVEQVIQLGAIIFSVGIRLVLPVIALLIMVDLALGLLGRLNAQLQLITLLFPAKILTSLAMLAWIVLLFPKVFSSTAEQSMRFVRALVGL